MKPKNRFWMWKARLKGLWNLLTKKYFVVIVCDDECNFKAFYNVNYTSFKTFVKVIDKPYQDNEIEAALYNELEPLGILTPPTP